MNILIIRTHRLGDILQLTPMLEGLKEKYPQSRISFLVGADYAGLLEDNPHVDEIIPIPEKEYRYWLQNSPERYPRIFNEMYDLITELRQKEFQIVINRQYEWGAMIAYLVGAETTLGGSYSPDKSYFFEDQTSKDLFDTIRKDRRLNRRNLVDWACRIAEIPCGQNQQMFFSPSSLAYRQVHNLLQDNTAKTKKPLVAIQMGAAKSFRQWENDNFTKIVQWLIHEKDRTVVLLGSKDEKDLGEYIDNTIGRQKGGLINLIGQTDLNTLGAVLATCECLITGDTGPMHVAAAVGTPVLSLFFGTAYPWETGPYGPGHFVLYSDVPCAPCLDPADCQEGHRCKREIKADTVKRAFETANAFWKHEPWHWQPYNNGVTLLVTARDENGEQKLLAVQNTTELGVKFPKRILRQNPVDPLLLKSLIKIGDDVIGSLDKGEAEKGFLLFAEYLDSWLGVKDEFLNCHSETEDILSDLLAQCLLAIQNKDLVTLMDIVEYGFKPMIQQTLIQDQGLKLEREHACI